MEEHMDLSRILQDQILKVRSGHEALLEGELLDEFDSLQADISTYGIVKRIEGYRARQAEVEELRAEAKELRFRLSFLEESAKAAQQAARWVEEESDGDRENVGLSRETLNCLLGKIRALS